MTNSTSNTTEEPTNRDLLMAVTVVIFVFGMIGNILVMVILGKKPKRSIHQMFILNLALSDVLFILLVLPFNAYDYFATLKKSEFFCRVVFALQTITYFISIFTITSMAVHRCYVIVNPYKRKLTAKVGYIWITLVWCASFVIVLPLIIVNKSVDGQCIEHWLHSSHGSIYTAALFVLQFLLPLSIIAAAYTKIGVFLIRQKAPQTSIGNRTNAKLEKKRKENKQIITTLAAIVVIFTFCLLPGQIAWMIEYFGTPSQIKKIQVVYKFSSILDFIHACVNPILYGLLTDTFRKDYKDVFSNIVSCGKATITPDHDSSINMHPEEGNGTGANEVEVLSENASCEDVQNSAKPYVETAYITHL